MNGTGNIGYCCVLEADSSKGYGEWKSRSRIMSRVILFDLATRVIIL